MPTAIEQLKESGLVNVNYPADARIAVENAIISWKKFCKLNAALKQQFGFVEMHTDGTGYELKEEKGSRKDLKENFQITLSDMDRLKRISNDLYEPEAIHFIDCAHELIKLIEPLVLQFAESVETKYQVQGMREEVLKAKNQWIFRYLHYFSERPIGEEIAAAHIDKAAFTLHLYESHTGLQFLNHRSRQWDEMPVLPGQTVVIPAMQLQLESQGVLKALYHRVVATEETTKTGRYSLVCFIPMLNARIYNKNAKGRTQNYEPGFNYDISHADFSELFHH